MKKYERFFGLHFDFHAENTAPVGSRTTKEDIEWYINQAKPDFIQCDCKGHPGIASYPTKIGKAAENMKTDNFKIWSEVAKSNNIPLFIHYSGVYETEYTRTHPEHAQVKRDGTVTESVSLFSNYAEEYMVPQIKELIDMYDIDGVWVDGDCWSVYEDYSELALKHIGYVEDKQQHAELIRAQFIKYIKTCSDMLHAYKPSFKYMSNWAYSSFMPEKPLDGVFDSLSGDYLCTDSMLSARYDGRCLAAQNMPWDLMCWSFMLDWGGSNFFIVKSEQQLKQEAATVLMLGGGFQLYICQNSDGSAKKTGFSALKGLGEFVRARHMLFEKRPLAQVGIYYSKTHKYKHCDIYNPCGTTNPLIGTVNSVLAAQYTANIVLEHQLDTLASYDIVVVPEWYDMSSQEKEQLFKYAQNGGKLLILGAELTKQIGQMCGLEFTDDQPKGRRYICDVDGGFEAIYTNMVRLKQGEGSIYHGDDLRDALMPAYNITDCGKGKIAFIPFDLGTSSYEIRTQKKVRFLKNILQKLAAPVIEINTTNIELSMLENGDGLYINLLNLYQNRMDLKYEIYDEVPPLYNVELTVRKPYKTVCMPLGEQFSYEVCDGCVKIHIDRLDIHSVIELK